jgi:hypothetical protein
MLLKRTWFCHYPPVAALSETRNQELPTAAQTRRLRPLSTYEKTYVVRHHFQNTSVVYRTVLLEDAGQHGVTADEVQDALDAMQKRHTALRCRIVAVKPRAGPDSEGASCGAEGPFVCLDAHSR